MLGDNIKRLRNEQNYTQEDLANKLKISKSTIGMYEQNRRSPDLNTLLELANIFAVSVDSLLEYTPPANTDNSSANFAEHTVLLTSDEKELLSYYNKLSLLNKRWIMGQIITLIKDEELRSEDKVMGK